mmetsp:Transcript_19989/g.29933  ORF Transcript_19989/g.29933 Transcript_19989/m.29933 type:complete len:494 (-) Transcript_19989:108-1589(-)
MQESKNSVQTLELISAATAGDIERINALVIDEKVDVNSHDSRRGRPLQYAAEAGEQKAVVRLLELKAHIEASDETHKTAFAAAVLAQQVGIAKLLLEHKANPNVIVYMSSVGYNPAGREPLISTIAARNDVTLLNLMIEHKAFLDTRRGNGHTPLARAAVRGHSKIVKKLIECSVNIETPDKWGRSPFQLAVHQGHKEVMKLLLDAKAQTGIGSSAGEALLLGASRSNDIDIMKILLRNKADLELKGKHNRTPLAVVCNAGHRKAAQRLIELKANIQAVDFFGLTPLTSAVRSRHWTLAIDLVKYGGNPNDIITYGGNHPNDITEENISCLGSAVTVKYGEYLAKTLIEYKANVNYLDSERTVLSRAISGSKLDEWSIIKLLVDAKADVNKKNKDGSTALLRAVTSHVRKDPIHVVAQLVRLKADINIRDERGRTAHDIVSRNHCHLSSKFLRLAKAKEVAYRDLEVQPLKILADLVSDAMGMGKKSRKFSML